MASPLRAFHRCPSPATQNVAWQATFSPGLCGSLSPVPREQAAEQPDNDPVRRKENQNGQDKSLARPGIADAGTPRPRRHRRRLHQVANPLHSRRTSDARPRPRGAVFRTDETFERTGKAQCGTISAELHVRPFPNGNERTGRKLRPVRKHEAFDRSDDGVHRAWNTDAGKRIEKRCGGPCQHSDHEHLRGNAESIVRNRPRNGPDRGSRKAPAGREDRTALGPAAQRGALRRHLQGDGRRMRSNR